MNPNEEIFEVIGYYEEFLDAYNYAYLGQRAVVSPEGRKFGHAGQQVLEITQPLVLTKGYNTVTLQASPSRPLSVVTMLQKTTGKQKWKHPQDQTRGGQK